MMITAAKIIEKARFELSKLIVRQSRPCVRHCRANGGNLLVLANEDVGRRICFAGGYERGETALLARILKPTDICFDVGANVGYFTMLMARCASAGAVHAFEPQRLGHALLSASSELNRFHNVFANNCAVGAQPGRACFSVSQDSAYSSLIDTKRKPELRVLDVDVTTLDGYCSENKISRIDVLKVDVEGAEELVLKGARGMLENPSSRPRMMMIELYGPNLEPFDSSVEAIIGMLGRHAYRPHAIASRDGDLVPFETSMTDRFYNVVFLNS